MRIAEHWDDVTVTEELVTIRMGTIQIALPGPLDAPWRELAANPGHNLTASPSTPTGYSAEPHPAAISTQDTSRPVSASCSAPEPRDSEPFTS